MKPLREWPMHRRLLCLTLCLLPVTGCASAPPAPADPTPAICVGSQAARTKLAAVLAETQDERALMAGAELIDVMDAGCAG